jgi:hypothetical protein
MIENYLEFFKLMTNSIISQLSTIETLFENTKQAHIYMALLQYKHCGIQILHNETGLHRETLQRELKKMAEVVKLDLNCIQKSYKKRPCDSHKGTQGHALLIAGSTDKIGAAIIASKVCLRSGVGLLTVAFSPEKKKILFNSIPEAMYENTCVMNDLSPYQAIGIGPGIGVDEISLQYIY